MARELPDLSRFELQCLRLVWERGDASARDVHASLDDPPSYSTVRTILTRLEDKGAIVRTRRDGKAWVYRSLLDPEAVRRREVGRFLETLFGGRADHLVSTLTDMDALSVEDLRDLERSLEDTDRPDEAGDQGGAR
jgi:BlaI family penicillinase repressor